MACVGKLLPDTGPVVGGSREVHYPTAEKAEWPG